MTDDARARALRLVAAPAWTSLSLLVACGGDGAGPDAPAKQETLTIAGSSTLQPVAELAAEAFEVAHPGVRVEVQGGGSGVGVSATRSGLAQIGMVSRSLKPDEADLTATPVALDGIALIVHRDNPVAGLTKDQVFDVWSGAASSWAALGGADRPITVVNKEEGRATLELFLHHFGLKDKVRADAVVIGPNGQAITTVAGNPDAVAYVSIGSATKAEQAGEAIRRVPLDGHEASVATVKDGSYPLSRELIFVTKGPPSGVAKDFVDFVRSPEGQAIAAREDFIPVGEAGPVASP
ncbi:MAG: phosphate ABC transporter substrate-binding protein [Myxococcota bacterium]